LARFTPRHLNAAEIPGFPTRGLATERSPDLEESSDFQYNLMSLFADGGLMMYALVLCSLVALGVIIAKAWTLWVAHRDTDRVLAEVQELTEKGGSRRPCAWPPRPRGPPPRSCWPGCAASGRAGCGGGDRAGHLHHGTIELGFLERGLVILATIANVAPLMGFLGTVAGMILAFGSIELAGDVNPTLVAGGIKVALLTTATGLLIAIPVNLGYNFFVTRIDKLIVDMEQGTQQILNLAWDMEKAGRLEVYGAAVPAEPSVDGDPDARGVAGEPAGAR
jgi:biopolymer transport protein ExbB